jgi:hypothetical protein
MPRAAPGDNARGALRRDPSEALQATVKISDSCKVRCPFYPGLERNLHRYGSRSQYWCSFTQEFSGFGVERGGLGEVVSLVGDCRPPPPGNPRRLTILAYSDGGLGWRCVQTDYTIMGEPCFTPKNPISGEVLLSGRMFFSLNSNPKRFNLKELNNPQYFKINRSFFSCMGRKPVLQFGHIHSHLCGHKGVKPPPIAITNVLETR